MALTALEEKIMNAIGRHRVSISEIEQDFFSKRPSRRTIQRVLQHLIKNNLVRQTGACRGTRYEKIVVTK